MNAAPCAGAPSFEAARFRGYGLCAAALLGLAVAQGLVACRQDGAAAPAGVAEAPAADAERRGDWLGGPEAASGKLRSGIVSWWRLVPAQPAAGVPFELLLRLEEVKGADATVAVATGDGARWVEPTAPQRWALRPGRDAEISLRLLAPAGDSYLHVTTLQNGRSSVRSIRLATPPGTAASAPARGDYAVDAQGQPIVRMPSGR